MGEAGFRPIARAPLAARWRICAAPPGSEQPPTEGWRECDGPLTAAAALRARGEWSLDVPPLDFDAQDWWFHASFDLPEGKRAGILGFDGLATLAEVSINGRPLLASRNMFLRHQVPVDEYLLREQGNELLIRCSSLAPELAQRRPRPRWRTPMVAHQQLRWLRTTLLGRTPGWSPPAAPVGPWRGITWCSAAEALSARVKVMLDEGKGRVEVALQAPAGWASQVEAAEVVLRHAGREWRQSLLGGEGAGRFHATVEVDAPALWWPHTHGEPHLHAAALRVMRRDGSWEEQDLGRAGFRRIVIDTEGGGFRLRVNGEPVFCRGAGWTPLDAAGLRSDPAACKTALLQARDAGMNMLRLAGTMAYEEDHFYDACDELGLLVWQDFMFASMDYPFDDAAFAESCSLEARQQLARLSPHACLAVLCGNSEVEQQAAMWGAPREQWQPRFFHETLAGLCGEHAPGVPYWPSSAHGGAFPHVADQGTTSYYGVGAYERPPDDARRSGLKFATECLAFANVPAPATLSRLPGGLNTRVHHPAWKARSPRDLGAGWDFDDVRDHYVQRLFDVDPMRLRHADHDRYLALGRTAVAEVMRAAFAEWRRPGSACGGALLLFLRDLWAGAGWGVLDDQGLPKSGWHALRRALAPVAVFVTDEGGNGLAVHAVNETARLLDAKLELTCWRADGTAVAQGAVPVQLAARESRTFPAAEVLGQFLDLNHAYRFGPALCDAVAARLVDTGSGMLAESVHLPLGMAGLCRMPRASLDMEATASLANEGEALLRLSTRQLAIGVHFDFPGWCADDEHFHLVPGARREIRLRRVDQRTSGLAGSVSALNQSTAVPVEAFE
ncbi:glycosyl hydrolase 2 galactose-binding domain-containing protein [Ramlibacter humi]|uniref:beta-mannosidase n=1 Tax=Ramlibacter humi TaxID=2530451 RepID=A0A4Z0BFS0_9BURK|nr:glycoside hydrolase family 2 protein [Ramlibacter humi]TFY97660.1 glycoside hydrolase family 2 protein [Ramlibacter humi]